MGRYKHVELFGPCHHDPEAGLSLIFCFAVTG